MIEKTWFGIIVAIFVVLALRNVSEKQLNLFAWDKPRRRE